MRRMGLAFGLPLLGVPHLVMGAQVFSDVDDTLSCPSKQMRLFGAGVDVSWTRNLPTGSVIYPGVACLAVSLEKALNDSAQISGLNVLSARPQEAIDMGLLEIKQTDPIGVELQRCGGRLDASLYGDASAAITLNIRDRYLAFSRSKVNDLLGAVRNGESVVFMGDNGQGDLHAAVEMYKSLSTDQGKGAKLSAVFIHRVAAEPPLRVDDYGAAPIYFHNTAPGAALIAYCARLITRRSLQAVYSSAQSSGQHASCAKRCSPMCVFGVCVDSECQADPATGFPPGCTFHLEDLKAVETIISLLNQNVDVTPDCESVLEQSRVQFTPSFVTAMSTAARQGLLWSARSPLGVLLFVSFHLFGALLTHL